MSIKACCTFPASEPRPGRRSFLRSAAALAVLGAAGGAGLVGSPRVAYAALSKEQRDQLTPVAVLDRLKLGNERFRAGKLDTHDYLTQKRATAGGQYPAAAILSCIDSRAPAEIILDVGIGDSFNARVAGNIANDDILGSLEFACAVSGAKLILVMGHTACGAIKGAIDEAELGHLTALLQKIKPAIGATTFAGERTSKNAEFVDAVAKTNVRRTIDAIRQQSPILGDLEKQGRIAIAGSMYQLSGGRVEFFS